MNAMPDTAAPALDMEFVREQFPGLAQPWALLDNAGGSQIARLCVERINEFLYERNVQIGGSYDLSRAAAAALLEAREAARTLVNAFRPEEIVFAGTTTLLMQNLARSMRSQLSPGDEVIVTVADHESNIGPWHALEEFGIVIRTWPLNPDSLALELEELTPLLNGRTRLVAVTHASNILGAINPVREIADAVHAVGARLCVDGTAFAPHRALDVRALDVDYYAFSLYKVYGPHHAILYGRHEYLLELDTLYHYFYGRDKVPGKLEPGNANYELSFSVAGLVDYLSLIGARAGGQGEPRALLLHAFDAMRRQEDALTARLLGWLDSRPDCRVVGPTVNRDSMRVPTIAFKVDGHDSGDIARAVEDHRVAIRFGDFHSRRLIEHLGLDGGGGVVRVSMVHYNTLDEVDRLIAGLEETLREGR